MSEWWTYTLSDLQLFSTRTYYRLLETYNEAIWPAQVVALTLGLSILVLRRRAGALPGAFIAFILAGCWMWDAILFHLQRYATIHWAGRHFAVAFGLQAALLLWSGVRGRLVFGPVTGAAGKIGVGIFLFALLLQPLTGLLGRDWRQIELFGTSPDPTAVATLGVLLALSGRTRWELMVIPAIWCLVSGATLLATGMPDAWIMPLAAALALFFAIWKRSHPGKPMVREVGAS